MYSVKMASVPSALVGNNFKLEPEIRKQINSVPIEKRSNSSTQWNKDFDAITLDFPQALSVIREGIREGTSFRSSIYLPLLQQCKEKKSVSEAQMIHGHIIRTGSHRDSFLMTFLVAVYMNLGAMEHARKVFDKMRWKNVVTWTALMAGYNSNSHPELAIHVFMEMLGVGSYPSNLTLGAVLNGCSLIRNIELGKQIHAYTIKYNIEHDNSVGNELCRLYSKCGDLNSAVKAFSIIRTKNVVCWTTVISSCGDNGDPKMGLSLFREMISEGIEPNQFTFTSAFHLCCGMHDLGVGSQVHSLSIKLGYQMNQAVAHSVMHLYLKCGRVRDSERLFDEVLNSFLRLHRSGAKIDVFTFSGILSVCSSLVALQQGEQVHAQAIKRGCLSYVAVGNALVNLYNKCGSIEKASKAFLEMSTRTLISWNTMIAAYSQHGCSERALQLFEDMRLVGVRPDQITFVCVLSACRYAGMVDEALAYFEMMKKEYKIKPVIDHFACLIDMFVRLDRLDEAYEIMKKMDLEPNEFIWSRLITGYSKSREMLLKS